MASTPPPAEDIGDGGWGLSSVTSAFGGWGLTATADETSATGEGEPTTKTNFQDDEWRRQTREVEDAVASAGDQVMSSIQEAEGTLDETAKMAAAAASNFFSGASNYLMSGGSGSSAAEVAKSGTEAVTEDSQDDNTGGTEDPGALASILEYNPLNNLASQWINDLERKANADDPHRSLRQHLDSHLKDWPKTIYEEWVEESLVALEKWDRGSAVVDDTFYLEGNIHRNLWNERMATEENRCVPAKKPQTFATATTVNAASVQPSVAQETGDIIETMKEAPKAAVTTKTAPSVAQTAAALLNDDADLDGLLGDDDDEGEICFVSTPSSGNST